MKRCGKERKAKKRTKRHWMTGGLIYKRGREIPRWGNKEKALKKEKKKKEKK